jgi:NAD(P)-dependent dehydrogenase (short-subunit alcohol dehydrogenase family)
MMATRNERLRLPDILRHHRRLGVTRFLIVDNGSSDGTIKLLEAQPDVDLWLTEQPYSEAELGARWYNELAVRYGQNRWYLIIDADEMLVYPGMSTYRLPELCAWLTSKQVVTIRAPMIDLYPKGLVHECHYESGDRLIETFSYFDGDSYGYRRTRSGGLVLTGGPRARLLSSSSDPFQNVLEKYPLRFWRQDERLRSLHLHPGVSLRTPPVAALLHFKFMPDFQQKVEEALETGQHWRGSQEYRHYAQQIEALSCPYYAGSLRYRDPESLVSAGLIKKLNLPSLSAQATPVRVPGETSRPVALITGSSRGIGQAIALALAARHFRIILHGRQPSAHLDATARLIEERDGIVEQVTFDLKDVGRHSRHVDEVFAKFGAVHCLVNNAGVSVRQRGDLFDIDEAAFDEQQQVNVRGTFFLTQAIAQRMLGQERDAFHSIVNITSSNAVAASIERSEYCMAKASLSMMSQLFAVRLAGEGINVYEIRPGLIRTDMTRPAAERYDRKLEQGFTPINRWGLPDDVAGAVVPIAEGAYRFTTGEAFHVDGGMLIHHY